MTTTPTPLTYKVPLSISADAIAQKYTEGLGADRQDRYLNILAMLAVQYFLTSMGIQSEIDAMDSPLWNVMVMSDVILPELGIIHCQPLRPDATHLQLSPEVWEGRLGYLAVQFQPDLREAEILGFTSHPQESIALNQLDDIEEFLIYLEALQSESSPSLDTPVEPPQEPVVNLREWLTGTITSGWADLKDLLDPPQAQWSFRGGLNPTKNGEPIEIPISLEEFSLALVISMTGDLPESLDLNIQIHPLGENFLPLDLMLQVEEVSHANIIQETIVHKPEKIIQLNLQANPGDHLRVVIKHREQKITRDFLV
jgi:hypothetical protein